MVEKTGKFVSPFTASDSVQQLNSADTQGIHFTMPDDDDFNPDSMLPELTKPTPDLDDSLCFDEGEETQLPFDELDIGVPSVSELHEDNSTTHTEPNKGSREDLNDSLCGDNANEETQYHMDTANDIQPAAQSTPTPNLDDSMEMAGEDDTLQATTHSPEASKLPPSQTKVSSAYKGASDDDPNLDELFPETIHDLQGCSQEGSKTRGTEGDSSKTNKTEGGSNKLEGCSDKLEKSSSPIQQSSKVVPSFGKKKKGFMPPTVKAPDPASSSSSGTATRPTPKTKEPSATSKTKGQNCEGANLDEKSSVGKTQQNQKNSGANKENSPSTQETTFSAPKLADTSVTTTDNKVATAELSANVTTAEKTKATVKKPPQGKKDSDAKKQEKEKKKLEKEQKKLEQEQKKAEKERLKEEKRLEQERKKAEREQKKLEKDQKKLEREQKKAQKQQKPQKKKTPGKDSGAQASSNSEAQHNGSCEQDTAEKTSETNQMAASEDKASAVSNCGGTSASESADNSNKLLDSDSTSPSETISTASTDAAETMPPSECKPNAPEGTATETSSSEKVQDDHDREMLETMKPREANLSSPGETSAEDPGDSVVTKQLDVSATTNSFNQTNSDGVSSKQSDMLQITSGSDKKNKNAPQKMATTLKDPVVTKQLDVSATTNSFNQTNSSNGVSSERPSEKSDMLQVTSGSDKENMNAPQKMATTEDPQKQKTSKSKKNQANKSARKQESASSQTQNKKKTKSVKTQNNKKVSSSAGARKRKTMGTQSTSESEIEPPEPKKPRSKPSNYYGPVWVQCEKPDCQKWRQLKDCLDPSEIPDKWTCSMNTESAYSSCLAPEEQWSEPEDSQEFVESPFVPGSIVWAKMDGYPWWPAMMEEDPDREAYYEMGEHRNVPVRYHVVFFDTPVCRAWVLAVSVQPFSEDSDANEAGNVTVAQKYRRALREGIKQAKKALKMTVVERLSQLTFAKRFCQTAGSRKRKYLMAEENVSDSTYHRSGAKPRGGSRKSSRLGTSKLTEEDASCDVKQQVASANDSMHSSVSVGTIAPSMEGGEEDESLKVGSKEDSSNVLREVEE